jgi:ABC-type transport system substrate-binding protein
MEFNSVRYRRADRDFDGAQLAIVPGPGLEDDRSQFHCSTIENFSNRAGFCDERIDWLLDNLPTIDDRGIAAPLWSEYQHRLAELQPYTFLFRHHPVLAVHPRLRGLSIDDHGNLTLRAANDVLVGARDWWIAPGMR